MKILPPYDGSVHTAAELASGSVTHRVAARSDVPLLLVRSA